MASHEPPLPVYVFERLDGIDEALEFVPLAARRALDHAGLKLSLAGWRSLPIAQRRRIASAGAGDGVSRGEVAAALEGAAPPADPFVRRVDPEASAVPAELAAALGSRRPLDDARWRGLRPLDRYALAKLAGRGDKVARAYDEIVAGHRPIEAPAKGTPGVPLSHLTASGDAHMVDIGAKVATARKATATARVRTTPEVVEAVASGGLAKGDVLAVARVAGLLAAKRTPELIPLCHPVQTTSAAVDFEPAAGRGEIVVRATVEAFDRTGVEMEAMVAASVASLTVYDMIKSADRWATIEAVRLEEKSGGKSGPVRRPGGPSSAHRGANGPSPDGPPSPPDPGVGPAALVALRQAPLSLDEAVAGVTHAGAGAICAFLGVVRHHNDGHAVAKLEYEAYASMAVAEMERIAREIAAESPGVRLAVIHRTGSLVVGDVAVVCASSAPHRAEAYAACRALIDRVKARVPIWKREHGPEGASWIGWQDARCDAHDHDHER